MLMFQACISLEENYMPPVTFIVVQKRHHTRFFPVKHDDRTSSDRNGNILPGCYIFDMLAVLIYLIIVFFVNRF